MVVEGGGGGQAGVFCVSLGQRGVETRVYRRKSRQSGTKWQSFYKKTSGGDLDSANKVFNGGMTICSHLESRN